MTQRLFGLSCVPAINRRNGFGHFMFSRLIAIGNPQRMNEFGQELWIPRWYRVF